MKLMKQNNQNKYPDRASTMISFGSSLLHFYSIFHRPSPRLRYEGWADKETIIVRKDNVKEAESKLKLSVSYANRESDEGGEGETLYHFPCSFFFGAHDEEPDEKKKKELPCT